MDMPMREFPFQELAPQDKKFRDLYPRYRVWQERSELLREADVAKMANDLLSGSAGKAVPQRVRQQVLGQSLEGRTIRMLSMGNGERRIFMWTQMHGDESTHTSVVLAVLNTLVELGNQAFDGANFLGDCTLHVIPMLNPDGAERQTRENAQGIDINRDAVELNTREGRILHDTVLKLKPHFGFNLHNQRADKTVTGTGKIAVLSVLAPPLDYDDSDSPSVIRARQLAIEMFAVGERLLPGHSTRYEAGYMPTAFGEWVQAQGASTMLLEAGGWPEGQENGRDELHYVTLMNALRSIHQQAFAEIDSTRYAKLPLNKIVPSKK